MRAMAGWFALLSKREMLQVIKACGEKKRSLQAVFPSCVMKNASKRVENDVKSVETYKRVDKDITKCYHLKRNRNNFVII